MAGSRLSKPTDDSTKKRKREVAEADTRSKRSKAQQGGKEHDQAEPAADGDVESENNVQNGALLKPKSTGGEEIVSRPDGETGWRISKPMGGRMLDIDPILTQDDQ